MNWQEVRESFRVLWCSFNVTIIREHKNSCLQSRRGNGNNGKGLSSRLN